MTELQSALLIIGTVLVVAVLAYNRIQERRARRSAEQAFRSAAGDALMSEPAPPAGRVAAAARAAEPRRDADPLATAIPDERIDYLVELQFPSPVPVGRLREHWQPHEHRYAKRARLAWLANGGESRPMASGDGEALGLQAGLQLATRDGAVGEAELIEFRAAVESIAADTGASVTAPEMRLEVERARELDAFCMDADIQVRLQVVAAPNAALDLARVREAALDNGLSESADGGLALLGDGDEVEFALGRRDGGPLPLAETAADGIALTLDVARVSDVRKCFRAMAELARVLAASQGGVVADDEGRELGEREIAAIDGQLGAVQAAFAARRIPPGSTLAARLFA